MFSKMNFRRWFLKINLRTKVTLGVVVPLILILGVFTFIEYFRHRAAVWANLSLLASQSGQVIEDNLRHQMLESDNDEIQEILNAIERSNEFELVYILDPDGYVMFAPDNDDIGLRLDNRRQECQPCHSLPPEVRPSSVIVDDDSGERVFRSMHPIENAQDCAECHDPEERLLGVLLTDISTAPFEAPLAAGFRENILWWIGTILVTIIVVNLALSRLVLGRLEGLVDAFASLGQGKLPPEMPTKEADEIGQLTDEFMMMAKKVEARRQENQALSERLQRQNMLRGELLKSLISAQEDERKRVARELHDELGQALGGLSLRAEVLEQLIAKDSDLALEQLEQIRQMIGETSERMYDLILAMRPSALDDLGLVPALRTHAERTLKNSDIRFEIDASDLRRRLPASVETTLFRISQEAITNVMRHADASELTIRLACTNGILRGEIADNGRGFDVNNVEVNGGDRRGLGLLGMQERVTQCGGRLEILSRPGLGTTIQILIPLEEILCE